MTILKTYDVSWTITVTAKSPQRAAQLIWKEFFEKSNKDFGLATVLEVKEHGERNAPEEYDMYTED